MARSNSRRSPKVVVNQKIPIEVRRVPFKAFESVRHLDIARLSRAKSARFEVGYFESDCCRRIVHAVVKNGRVTKLEPERCKHPVRLTPEMSKLMRAVRSKLGRTTFRSTPVSRFLAGGAGITIDISFCFIICIYNWCLLCCYDSDPGPGNWNGCSIDKWPDPP
jgi:hypothetical protein